MTFVHTFNGMFTNSGVKCCLYEIEDRKQNRTFYCKDGWDPSFVDEQRPWGVSRTGLG